SFQQRQRANRSGSKDRFGTVPCQVSQSSVGGERSVGGGYSQAPVGSLRPSEPSTSISSPRDPFATRSFALAQVTELTCSEPNCTIRPVFLAASAISTPSAAVCDMGFSQ